MMYNYNSQNRLRELFNSAGLTVLFLLVAQNLMKFPFLLLRNRSFLFMGHGMSAFSWELVSIIVYLSSMGLSIVVGSYIFHANESVVFPMAHVRSDYLWPAMGTGLGVAMLGNLTAILLSAALSVFGIRSADNAPSFAGGLPTILLTLFGVTILPAVMEELLFRGLLMQPLRKYGDRLAVVASAIIFALCHPTLPQAVNAFIIGLVLGLFAVRTGSLAAPMLLHFIYNCISCATLFISTYCPYSEAILFSWGIMALFLVVGIISAFVLRRRFGRIWWISKNGELPTSAGFVWKSAFTSIPALAAIVFCVTAIAKNLFAV